MTALVYALIGLFAYLSAVHLSLRGTVFAGIAAFILSIALIASGAIAGVRSPRFCAACLRMWALTVASIAGAVSAGLTAVTILVISGKGQHPPPRTEGISAAVLAVITLFVGLVSKAGDRWTPSWLSRTFIRMRYGSEYEDMPADQPKLDAYYAIRRDEVGLKATGPVRGWGYLATVDRLKAIKAAR